MILARGMTEAGGGFMGIGPARYVSDTEKATSKWVQDLFDFFAGTSVGSIDTGMYGCGFHGQDVLDLHHESGDAIFGKKNIRYTLTKCGPQYDDSVILALLKEKCKDRTMAETVKPTYLTAWDMRRKQLKVFGPADKDIPVWFAIRCSMAATTYFSTPDGRHGDGGFCANDPLLVGFAGIVMDDSVEVSGGIKMLNLVTSGMNPEGPAVGNDWFVLTYLRQIILKAITTGNSSDMEFIRKAINKFVQKLMQDKQDRFRNFRVNPECKDFQLDETIHSREVESLWATQFQQDKAELLPYLLGS